MLMHVIKETISIKSTAFVDKSLWISEASDRVATSRPDCTREEKDRETNKKKKQNSDEEKRVRENGKKRREVS